MRILGLDVRRPDSRSDLGAHLGLVLDRLAVTHVIDVGANVGQFARLLRDQAGFTGRVDSYEPASGPFGQLVQAMAGDAGWHGHQVAVGATPAEVVLRLFSDSSLNSTSAPTEYGVDLFNAWEPFAQVGEERVAQVRLDDEGLPDVGPVALKVDTQGTDFDVLDGATRLLDRTRCLLVELSFLGVYEASTPANEALRRLRALGFDLAGLFPITRDASDDLRIVEADGIFVRRAGPTGG